MTKWRPRKNLLVRYLFGVTTALVVADIFWQFCASDVLYCCTDSMPWELFNFGPTFAHTDFSRYGNTGDWRAASEFQLRLLQSALFAAALIIPALALRLTGKFIRYRQTRPEPI